MAAPSVVQTFFAPVFGASAASAPSKLPFVLFPFPAFPVGALSNAASGYVLSAHVTHYDASPILLITLLLCSFVDVRIL
jgi:hypothetical protein